MVYTVSAYARKKKEGSLLLEELPVLPDRWEYTVASGWYRTRIEV